MLLKWTPCTSDYLMHILSKSNNKWPILLKITNDNIYLYIYLDI